MPSCLGVARDSGVTFMIPEHRPCETIFVLPKNRVKYVALKRLHCQSMAGVAVFPRTALPHPVVLPCADQDEVDADATPYLVEACCEPNPLLS